jgi:hypothetical protein
VRSRSTCEIAITRTPTQMDVKLNPDVLFDLILYIATLTILFTPTEMELHTGETTTECAMVNLAAVMKTVHQELQQI